MTGLRAKEAQCFSSVIASPAFYGFSSSNRYEQDVSDDVVQVHPATEIVLVPRLLLSSFEPGNGPVPSEYSVFSIPSNSLSVDNSASVVCGECFILKSFPLSFYFSSSVF